MNLLSTCSFKLLPIPKSTKGITLVELMVVVAILGILASIATVAYGRYIKTGKIQRLQQLALDIASGQERYRSRNYMYYPADGNEVTYDSTTASTFQNLLDFTTVVPAGITITVDAWAAGGSCDICEGIGADTTRQGFAVSVKQDLIDGGVETTLIQTNQTPSPVMLNEGE